MANRNRQNIFDGPVQDTSALVKGRIRHAESLGVVFERSRKSVECNYFGSSLVNALLFSRRPSAIIRFVIAISVDAINRVFCGWAWSHIGVKGLKGIQPSLAHFDAFLAVSLKTLVRHSGAPVDNSGPNTKFRTTRHAVGGFSFEHFDLDAPARMSALKVCAHHLRLFAAVTAAYVERMFRIVFVALKAQDGQASIAVSDWQRRQNHEISIPYFALAVAE